MDGNLHVNLGDAAVLEATHPLRNTTRFFRAVVRDSANAAVTGSPFSMSHNGNGVYRTTAFTPPAVGTYQVEIEAYTDAGFTTLDQVVCPLVAQMEVDEQVAQIATLHNTRLTATRAGNLDFLDVAVSSRQSEVSAAARAATNTSQHTQTQTDISNLNNLAIADIQTALSNQGYTTLRAGLLDNLDATVSSRAIEANAVTRQTALLAQHTATQGAITALNNLSQADVQAALTTQGYTVARAGLLDNLDAAISTRVSETDQAARQVILVAEHDATQAAIAALENLSEADIQNAMDTQGYTSARAALLDNADVAISTRVSETDQAARQVILVAEHDATQAAIAALNNPTPASIADAVWDEARLGHVASGSFGEALQGVLSPTRAGNLDNLDATISSRAVEANAVTRQTAVLAQHTATQGAIAALNDIDQSDVQAALTAQGYTGARATLIDNLDAAISTRATQASVDNIQNNTRFAGVVPAITQRPETGSVTYKLYARLFDTAGNPEDPDSNAMNIRIEEASGSVVVATVAMTRISAGVYEYNWVVPSTLNTVQHAVIYEYAENSVNFSQVRTTIVSEQASSIENIETTVNTINTKLGTPTLASVSADINSRQSEADANTRHLTLVSEHNDTQADIAALNDLSSADIQAALTAQGYTVVRAALLDNLDAAISTRVSETDQAARQVILVAEHDATQAAIAALENVSIADVQTALTNQGYTAARAVLLDNLDAAITTRQSESDAATRAGTNQAEHDATQAAIAALENLSQSDIQAAMTAQGYTAVRAALLDNMDVAISTRESDTDALARFNLTAKEATASGIKTQTDQLNFNGANVLSEVAVNSDKTGYTLSAAGISAVADQVWEETMGDHVAPGTTGERLFSAGSGSISPAVIAQIVDDVWDEPTADHMAAGTMGEGIGNAAIYTPQNVANAVWDTQRSTRQSAGTFGEANQGVLSSIRAGYLDNLPRLDVVVSTRSNVTQSNDILNQVNVVEGRLTAARATNLDNLNASITSRATQVSVDALPLLDPIIDGVWDENQADHLAPGTMGESLQNAGATANPSLIADAVWDELKADHSLPGTFGALLDVAVSSRATDADLQLIKGAGFNTATDSLEQIRDNIGTGGGGGGDATEAKQDAILNAVALKANQSSVNNITTLVGMIPTNPLLQTSPEVAFLDVAISSRLSTADFNVIKGAGFNPATDTLEQIAAGGGGGGSCDLTPVLNSLNEIKGAGFDAGEDSLAFIEPKIAAAKASADQAASDAVDAKNAANAASSQASVNSLITAVGNIPTNPVLTTDIRIARLDATISSRADAVSLNQLSGPTFNPATDSNEAIRNAIAALGTGDATAANQTAIINALASKATQASVNAVATAVGNIPLNTLLTTDTRLDNLDVAVSSRASDSDMQQIKGGGFTTGSHSLVEIANAISAASLDLTPVLAQLNIIKGSGFAPGVDDLDAINDCNKSERAGIRSDTQALLADGEGF